MYKKFFDKKLSKRSKTDSNCCETCFADMCLTNSAIWPLLCSCKDSNLDISLSVAKCFIQLNYKSISYCTGKRTRTYIVCTNTLLESAALPIMLYLYIFKCARGDLNPLTPWLKVRCIYQLSYERILFLLCHSCFGVALLFSFHFICFLCFY